MILHGDCIEKLKTLPDNSVDSVVTDPPYGIRFMGKSWDGADIEARTNERRGLESHCPGAGPNGGHKSIAAEAGKYDLSDKGMIAFQEFSQEWARECLRVLKPGGHLLSFASCRTYHRMAVGIEMAGFEIRDQMQWIFGSGFPKSHNISKSIDKSAGAKREVIGTKRKSDIRGSTVNGEWIGLNKPDKGLIDLEYTAPATEEAIRWDGWGTALKPANEPIVVARKPLEKGLTVAANVLKWGTGAINIDGSRIEAGQDLAELNRPNKRPKAPTQFMVSTGREFTPSQGRWPANILFDEAAAELLPIENKQSVSRFFYCAKASKSERNAGLENVVKQKQGARPNSADSTGKFPDHDHRDTGGNNHPTVKPIKLMQYLIKLVTPQNGTVLDPFFGSGSTGVAAVKLGFNIIGIEREDEYVAIATSRLASAQTWIQGEL